MTATECAQCMSSFTPALKSMILRLFGFILISRLSLFGRGNSKDKEILKIFSSIWFLSVMDSIWFLLVMDSASDRPAYIQLIGQSYFNHSY